MEEDESANLLPIAPRETETDAEVDEGGWDFGGNTVKMPGENVMASLSAATEDLARISCSETKVCSLFDSVLKPAIIDVSVVEFID